MVTDAQRDLLHVLVVDDCPDTTGSLMLLLEMWGHHVDTANSGPEALRMAGDVIPDVVLLDIAMPGMDGWEVVRRLRAMPVLQDAYLIMVSGCARREDVVRSTEAGCNLHLTKPVEPDLLRRLMTYCKARKHSPGRA